MAGGMLGGGGDAWARDHLEILEHARGLGYDKVPGVSLPPADAPKETWISEMDKFNAWKASELAKPEVSRWWVTRPWSSTEGTVSGGGGSSGIGPGNPYYPQRVQAFTSRPAQDYSAIMPAGSPLAVNKGILYQADINSQGIPDSIWNYQPPMLYASGGGGGGLSMGTGGGGHFIPTGMLSVESHSPSSSSVPVGSAGYPQGDPRNPEDRGGPDRPDGGGGADTDTQTRHDTTLPQPFYPSQIGITPPAPSYPNTPPPGLMESRIAAELAAAEAAVAKAASDHQVEMANAQLAAAAQAAVSAGLLGGGGGSAIGKQIGRYAQLGLIPGIAENYGNPGGGGASAGKGSFGGMDAGLAGPR